MGVRNWVGIGLSFRPARLQAGGINSLEASFNFPVEALKNERKFWLCIPPLAALILNNYVSLVHSWPLLRWVRPYWPEGVLVLCLYLIGPDVEGPQAAGAPADGGGVEGVAEQGALVVAVPHVDRQGGRRRQGPLRCTVLRLYCHVVQWVLGQEKEFQSWPMRERFRKLGANRRSAFILGLIAGMKYTTDYIWWQRR